MGNFSTRVPLKSRLRWGGWLTLALLGAVGQSAARAENETAARPDHARAMVAKALEAEVAGNGPLRNRLLGDALAAAPKDNRVRWQNGYVRHRRTWLRFDQLPKQTAANPQVQAYRRERTNYPQTAEGQLALADWCARHRLGPQEQAHLTSSLDLDPEQPAVHERLGERLVGSRWVSAREVRETVGQVHELSVGLRQWTPALSRIARALKSADPLARAEAAEELRGIHDPAAVAGLQVMAIREPPEIALLAVEAIDRDRSIQASVALARVAAMAPWYPAGAAATDRLKSRRLVTFVPVLLEALETPLEVSASYRESCGKRLVYRQELVQEKESHRELKMLDTIFTFADRNIDTRSQARLQAEVSEALLESQANRANREIADRNERICQILRTTSGEDYGTDPKAWWQWWYEYNETSFVDEKPTIAQYASTQRGIGRSQVGGVRRKHSCLAAGTLVWTDQGARPIETIQTGDLVLSQDADTGELAYKPVLRTTIREGAEMNVFRAGDETIHCTGGHLFWLTGTGWSKARDLEPGQRLHALEGSLAVESNKLQGTATVYNLVVADFHSYFVGRSRILSHDVNPREATIARLPGLVEAAGR